MKCSARCAWRAILFVLVWMYCGFLEREGHAQQHASYTSFDNFTVQDGLPSNRARALLQDSQGFIWVGTDQGLVRYDGYDFVPFFLGVSDSLKSSIVNVGELFEDVLGNIWVGGFEGLVMLDPVTMEETQYYSDSTDIETLSYDNVFAIAQLDSTSLWVGTEKGLNRIELSSTAVQRYRHNSTDSLSLCGDLVTSLVFDDQQTLWVGTRDGLCSYDYSSDSFTYWPNLSQIGDNASKDFIRSLYLDEKNILWMGTHDGLYTFSVDRKRYKKVEFPFSTGEDDIKQVTTVASASEETILIGVRSGEVWSYNKESEVWEEIQFYNSLLHPNDELESIYDLHIDQSGLLWVSLWGQGLYKQIPYKAFSSYGQSPDATGYTLSHPEVLSVRASDRFKNLVWIGTNGGGLNVLDDITGRIISLGNDASTNSSIGSGEIWAIEESNSGILWVVTEIGIEYAELNSGNLDFELGALEFKKALEGIYMHSIIEDNKGHIWLGATEEGLVSLEKDNDVAQIDSSRSIKEELSSYSVWPLLPSKFNETLWIGTYGGGVNSLDLNSNPGQVTHYDLQDSSSLKYEYILTIQEDDNADIWIGTLGEGLLQLTPELDRVKRYSVNDGLPHNSVSCIQVDVSGNLWVGTYNGFAFFDTNEEIFYKFTERDGLSSNYFFENACHSDSDGTIYFGTKNGLVSFDPSSIFIDERAPKVVITGVDLYNEPIISDTSFTHKKVVDLKYDENYLRVHFSGLHYATPNENVYSYQLEGIDREWIRATSTQRFANYTNLAPGTYVFRVRAANSDGVWNEQGASLTFIIDRPYWQTWWFITLVSVFIITIAWSAHRYRVYHLLQVERTRQQISRDLHDDIGSSLNSIALFMDILVRKQVDKTLVKRLKYMAITARQLVQDLKDTVWVVNVEFDTLQALVARMEQLADNASSLPVVKCKVVSEIPDMPVKMEARRHILLIFKEALHNAQKHSEASKIEILVHCENERFAFNVKDNGVGFDQSTVSSGNGLKNFRDRANEMKAKLKIESKIGQGTLVGLSIKLADIRDGISWA
ncbi:MAG: hypothetical protein KTR29_02970 [Rhodothermaceae bacterium]|nr:hypothetical protein [Rhodothermaceae bacterium]